MHFGERCAFACRAGFELQGPTLRECMTPGSYDTKIATIYTQSTVQGVEYFDQNLGAAHSKR